MIPGFRKCLIFVVRTNSINNEVHITNQTGTKKKGGHTGASPAVISVPRMELVRGDPPLLFNQIHFIMRTKNDECNCEKCSGSYLIKKIIGNNAWVEIGPGIKNTLIELLLTYIRNENIDGESQEKRDEVAFHIYMINTLINDLMDFEVNHLKNDAA